MAVKITIKDETTSGQSLGEWMLELLTEEVTVRELIRSRVYQEVKDYNAKRSHTFRGLVQPEGAEKELNGYRLKKPRQLDWEKQFEKALAAFEGNGVIVLVGDRQAESLDEEFVVTPQTEVTFLRLVPLVGG